MNNYKDSILTLFFIIYGWNTYLDIRQYLKLGDSKIPTALKTAIDQKKFDESRAYGKDKSQFGFISGLYNAAITFAFIKYNFYEYFWSISLDAIKLLGFGIENEIVHSLAFLAIYGLFSLILSLPISLYSNFVIEERYGFNKQTLSLYISDLFKSLAIGVIIGGPVIAGVLQIIMSSGDMFYLYVWLFFLGFQLLMITIYPTLIQPLFNKFTPLEEGSLKSKIDALAKRIEFPLTKLFVVDGSKRSGHSNAYFFGFFKNKRIVLYDTLIEHSTEEEICAVLAHELGHWKHNHVFQMLIFSNIQSFLMFYLFGFAMKSVGLYREFGFMNEMPIIIGFMLFSLIFRPVDELTGFLANVMSRKFEFQADAFAKGLDYVKDLKSGLIKLNKENLGNMNPDKLYSAWHHSHPTLMERLNALDASKDKISKKKQ